MASASQKRANAISQKLTFLQDQGALLNMSVAQYVSRIEAAVAIWKERGDNKAEYLDLCQRIDSSVDFLWEKCEELEGGAGAVIENQLPQPPCDQLDSTVQSATSTSHRQPAEPFQPAGETQLKPVFARIAAIEEALCSFQSHAENVAQQQSGIDQQLKELLSKLSVSDNRYSSKCNKHEQMNEIGDIRVPLDQKQETRLQSLEKQMQELSTTQDRIKQEMEFQAELTEKLVHVPDRLESVTENLAELDARISIIKDDCSNKHQDIENITHDLSDKVTATTDTVQIILNSQDQKMTSLRHLEERLQTVEVDNWRSVKDVQQQAKNWKANFRILCQMVDNRLTPFEQLRTCLNQRVSTRDENIKKLSQVIQEEAIMSSRLQQLELKSSRTRCGFSAWASFKDTARTTIRPYQVPSPLFNVGGNFNAETGIFTAPADGLYVASISLYLIQNEEAQVSVRYNKQGLHQSLGTLLCVCSAKLRDTNACSVGVVDMKAGDTLFSYVNCKTAHESSVYFSCFALA